MSGPYGCRPEAHCWITYTEYSYRPSLLLRPLVFGYAAGASSSSLGAAAMALASRRIIDRVILEDSATVVIQNCELEKTSDSRRRSRQPAASPRGPQTLPTRFRQPAARRLDALYGLR
jgi:hypothetical protein